MDISGSEVKDQTQSNPAFGLAKDEPLTAEGIIRAAFANPDREKFPEFPLKLYHLCHYCHTVTDPEALIQRVKTELAISDAKLTQAQVRLHDVSVLWEHSKNGKSDGEPVDKEKFLETMKNCRWHGPH